MLIKIYFFNMGSRVPEIHWDFVVLSKQYYLQSSINKNIFSFANKV
jgi:hypothetical protein